MTLLRQGTNATLTVQWYEYQGGPASNVSAQTVTIIRVSDSVTVLGPTAVGITQLATGLYRYTWAISPTEVPGDYAVVWNATDFQLEAVQTSEVVTVVAAAVAGGPCPWDITINDECCPDWINLSVPVQTRAIEMATFIMWAATGRRYGACQNIVRPCGSERRCNIRPEYMYGAGWTAPYILNGEWRNCSCTGGCTCEPRCQVKLDGPVLSVSEVMVDGVIISDTLWRVDDNQWLVRTDGECWPTCQDYDVDVPEVGSFQVIYLRGNEVPLAVLDAAATLACEIAKACAGLACRLPNRMTNLTRQGVTVSFVDIDRLLARGLTGLTEVDQVIVADNPYGHKARPFFYSYDTSPRVRTVTQA